MYRYLRNEKHAQLLKLSVSYFYLLLENNESVDYVVTSIPHAVSISSLKIGVRFKTLFCSTTDTSGRSSDHRSGRRIADNRAESCATCRTDQRTDPGTHGTLCHAAAARLFGKLFAVLHITTYIHSIPVSVSVDGRLVSAVLCAAENQECDKKNDAFFDNFHGKPLGCVFV